MRKQALRKSFVLIFIIIVAINIILASNIIQTSMNADLDSVYHPNLQLPNPSAEMDEILDIFNMTQIENFTDNYMEDIFNEVPIVGVTVSVVSNNTEVFMKGYGYADIESNSTILANQSMFEVASISKLFTWTSLMQLWEDGLLELDEDINTYLIDFQIPNTFPGTPITVQHLMDHTSGLDHPFSHHHTSPALVDLAKDGLPKRIRPPGEYSVYSTYEAILAGYVVQCVSGTPFEEYMDQNIFEPLGMNHSSFIASLDPEFQPHRVTGYEIIENSTGGDEFIPHQIQYERINPGGGLSSTAEDLAIFMSTILQNGTYNGVTILENDTVQTMLSISYTEHPLAQGWAHGWTEMNVNERQFFGHGGISYWMRSHLFICPEEDFGVFISLNTPNGFIVTWDYMISFFDAFFPDTTVPDPSATPYPNYQDRASKFTGVYIQCERPHKHLTKVAVLMGINDALYVNPTSEGYIQLTYRYPGINFVEVEENVFYYIHSNGTIYTNFDPIIFITDENGKPQHIVYSTTGFGYDFTPGYITPYVQQIALISLVSVIALVGIIEIVVLVKEVKKRKIEQKEVEQKVMFGRISTSILVISNSFSILLSLGFNLLFLPNVISRLFDWEPYPASLYVLLTLPVMSAAISSVFFVKMLSDFIRNKKIGWKILRIIYLSVYTAILVLMYLILFYWRILGYHL